MPDEKANRTAIYCRLAHADDAAMEEQVQWMRGYALQKGYSPVTVYLDKTIDFIYQNFVKNLQVEQVSDVQLV